MRKVAIPVGALVLAGMLAASCSSSSKRDAPADDGLADGGGDGAAGASDDAGKGGEDADIADAPDGLVPIDADRGEQDAGDAAIDGGDGESKEPECVFDQDCADELVIGVCEVPKCTDGFCSTAQAKIGTLCDDGDPCTQGDSCDGEGSCSPGLVDDECVESPAPNAMWFTEIMGNPQPIDGYVDEREGQWIEILVRAAKPIAMGRSTLVYYEWDEGESEPEQPVALRGRLQFQTPVLASEPALLVRSEDPYQNGNITRATAYTEIVFSKDRNARLLLMGPEWRPAPDELFPIPPEHVVDSVLIPAGTFSDTHLGRSWQVAMPLPASSEPSARVWCHTPPAGGYAYIEEGGLRNWGTPGAPNLPCTP